MFSKRKEYKVDDSTVNEKATCVSVVCDLNPAAKVKMSEAMQAKGYTDLEAAGFTLRQQVHWI